MRSDNGFFESLFDYSFTHFVTAKIVRFLYILATVFSGLLALMFGLSAYRLFEGIIGLLMLIVVAPLAFLIYVAWVRLILEAMIFLERIARNTREMVVLAGGEPQEKGAPLQAPIVGLAPHLNEGDDRASRSSVKYCPKCGLKASADSVFCTSCGHRFEQV